MQLFRRYRNRGECSLGEHPLRAGVILVRVMQGDAIKPYEVVTREWFHTEFAASLFGWMLCREGWPEDSSKYWMLDNKIAARLWAGDSNDSASHGRRAYGNIRNYRGHDGHSESVGERND